MTFGEKLRTIRKQKQLTQKELAEKLGTSQAWIAQMENRKDVPTLSTILRLAKTLEISANTLIKYEDAFVERITGDLIDDISEKMYKKLEEARLLENYRLLNETGQTKAIEQVELLTKVPEYKKDDAE